MKAATRLRLPVKAQLIFGYPGEDHESLGETVNLFKRIGHPGRQMSSIVPIPGTGLWEYARQHGLVEDSEEFLDKVREAFDTNVCIVNFTSFDAQALDGLRRHYDNLMVDNYVSFLLRHPWQLALAASKFGMLRSILLVRLLKRLRMYSLAVNIRRVLSGNRRRG